MAESRSRRSNAGRNIGSLINKELRGDEFYSTAYGGFEEDSNDDEYESEGSEEDDIDSDFDVDESGWGPDDDAEDVLQKQMKTTKKKTWIKPYKDPSISSGMQSATKLKSLRRPKKVLSQTVTSTTVRVTSLTPRGDQGSRNFRRSTQETSKGFKKRFEEKEMVRRRRKKPNFRGQDRKLTQEELLEEAKWTEIDNIASLEAYTRMVEEEKKKVKLKKKPWTGPMVRYLSVTMPVVSEVKSCGGREESVDSCNRRSDGKCTLSLSSGPVGGEESKEKCVEEKNEDVRLKLSGSESFDAPSPMDTGIGDETGDKDRGAGDNPDKCSDSGLVTAPDQRSQSNTATKRQETQKQSRNFLIFMDTPNFPLEYFPVTKPVQPKRRLCPVTRLPAKYIDPLTKTPYATPFAFKVIRTRYVNEAEEKCERRLMQLSSWLEEKKKKKKESS